MFTTMSPGEMTVDPIFRQNPDLPEVDNEHWAIREFWCDGTDTVEFSDGSMLVLRDGEWPEFDETMPWATRVEQGSTSGPLMMLMDASDQIVRLHASWNARDLPRSIDPNRDGIAKRDMVGCASSPSPGRWLAGLWLPMIFVGVGVRRHRRRRA